MKQRAGRGKTARRRATSAWHVIVALCAAAALVACSWAGPGSVESGARPLPEGYGRIYVLREKQVLYSAEPVTVSIDGATVGTLASGTYRSIDLPADPKSLTVALLLSRLTTHFDLDAGKSVYVMITMEASGLPPPRGAIGAAPSREVIDERGLFSIHFLDEPSAMAMLGSLRPAQ